MPTIFVTRVGISLLVVTICLIGADARSEDVAAAPDGIAERRLDLMRQRVQAITFRSAAEAFPANLEAEPLFRYDDLTRGYLDGTVWRLGAEGRPRAIVTAELCRDYYGAGPRIVFDFLSLSEAPFRATSNDVPGWTPTESAAVMAPLPTGPKPAAGEASRLFQMKRLAARFAAIQEVDGERLKLRLLPTPIDRYLPTNEGRSDAAMFLFVSGRMPGVALLIETDGESWSYGVGRLSGPSTLAVTLDDAEVWTRPPAVYQWDQPYTASNSPADIPGLVE